MDVRRIAEGLWIWTRRTRAGGPGADWPEAVGCVYYEAPDAVVLDRPAAAAPARRTSSWSTSTATSSAAGLPVVVLQTAHWHERSSPILRGRYEAEERIPARDRGVFDRGRAGASSSRIFIRPHRALVVAEIFVGDGAGGLALVPITGAYRPRRAR